MSVFKILSIDGGGIKGLYSARILQQFEEELQRENGNLDLRIADYFDLVCGTSTGGLIALGISLRIPMKDICNLYDTNGPKIFPRGITILKQIKQALFCGKYSDKALKNVLVELFQERTLKDSHTLLCIPSFDFTHGTYALFRYDHPEGNLNWHNKLKYVDVALATSAAPTYLPMAEIPEENHTQYVDGGVWANNPTLVGFTEAIRYFVGEGKKYNKMQILSVSSLNSATGKKPVAKRYKSFINWGSSLFDMSLTGQSEFTDMFFRFLQINTNLPVEYVRIPSTVIAGEQVKYIGLDSVEKKSLQLMKQFADASYHRFRHDELIKQIFNTEKTYKIK